MEGTIPPFESKHFASILKKIEWTILELYQIGPATVYLFIYLFWQVSSLASLVKTSINKS